MPVKGFALFIAFTATAAATVGAALLVSSSSELAAAFYISLASIVLAEAGIFLVPLLARGRAWSIGLSVLPLLYGAGVAMLGVSAWVGWPWRTLLAAHLMWLTVTALILAAAVSAGHRSATMASTEWNSRENWMEIQDRFRSVCYRLERIDDPPRAVLKAAGSLTEALRYSPTEATQVSEAIEREIASCLGEMETMLTSAPAGDTQSQLQARIDTAIELVRRRCDIVARRA